MDNKLNNMLNKFLANSDAENLEDVNKQLQEFLKKYNAGEIEYENTPLDDAYELLEKAKNVKTKNQALKLAKKAYETSNECFDAILFQVDLEDHFHTQEKMLDEGLAKERKRLEKEGYFDKENIGHFYGIFETRPYIRGLNMKAFNLALSGKLTQAKNICKEILKLNENDNTGIRYLLMAVYAMLEDKKELDKLYKKYPEKNLSMLFPIFAINYKLGNYGKAKEILKEINKQNPNFIKLFEGTLEDDSKAPEGYYSIGDSSEVSILINDFGFLIVSMPTIGEFILDTLSKPKKQK